MNVTELINKTFVTDEYTTMRGEMSICDAFRHHQAEWMQPSEYLHLVAERVEFPCRDCVCSPNKRTISDY